MPKANADAAPYAASIAISRRPRAGGSRPAPSPTHDAASIWNGSHGPMPPVSSADANSVVEPNTKPNPGPYTRPAEDEQEEHGFEAGGTGTHRAERRANRREDAEHRDRLRVHAAARHL